MDPASVIGVIGVVLQITKTIYAYGDAVLEYKNEVARLRSELFGMHAALTQIEQDLSLVGNDGRHTLASPNLKSLQLRQMLDETHTILEQLANTLQEDISRSRRLARRIIWPLKRPQIQDLATHLERLKSFFILATIRDTLEATRDIQLSIQALRQSIQDIQQSKEEQTLYMDAIRWLNPGDPQSIHTAASSARLDGTNSWFITGPFDNWVSGTSPLLWLNGKPGSGKTCLTAACVHKLQQKRCAVAYFYCSYNDLSSQEPHRILSSLIVQLCQSQPTARRFLVSAYDKVKSQNSLPNAPDIKTLIDLFGQMTNTLNSTFFILIDGVDECGKNLAIVLRAIFQIATEGKRARLMLSSTENVAHIIQESISKSKLTPNTVSMDLGKVSGDINDYINTQFSQQPKLKMLRRELRASLIERLQRQHHGSFRWTCTIDDLTRRHTPKAIEKALDGVAPTLGEIYMGILQGVPDDMVQAAASMLQCLVSSLRQLTISELSEAVSFTFSDDFDEDDRLIEPEAVVHSLYSLVHYDLSSQRIELAHSSVRDFLTSPELTGKYHVDSVKANIDMSRICVHYLTLPSFEQVCSDQEDLNARKQDWPLLEYASAFWTRHIRVSPQESGEHLTAFSRFAASSDLRAGGNFAAWYQVIYPQGNPRVWSTKPLYMCAREGLIEPLRTLLATCTRDQIEHRGGARGSTALHVAATYGETEAVKLLLAAGADPNEHNDAGENGIQWAALYDHTETVRLLLEAGALPDLLRPESNPELHEQMVRHSLVPSSRHLGTEGSGKPGSPKKLEAVS
ncbi:ankyrin repeat protein [Aureobasidium pullulans]|nr:ankyrin repeat protein [Aureobasidium pullulans]